MEGDSTIDDRLELIIKQQEAVRQQMADLQQTLDTLEFKRWYYETAQQAGTTDVLTNMPLEQLPEKYREVRKRLQGSGQKDTSLGWRLFNGQYIIHAVGK